MMGLYMTARMNPDEASLNNPECSVEDIQNLRDMYAGFKEAFEAEAHAIALLLNFQNYVLTGTYTEVYTAEEVLALSSAKITQANSKFKVQKFDEFVKDYKTISSDLEKLEEIVKAGGTIKWQDSGLNAIVNNLVGANGHLFVVGDPYQCIYGFRGSDITNILNFERDFLGTKIINTMLVDIAKTISMNKSYFINIVSIISQIAIGIIAYFSMLILLKDDYYSINHS